MRITLILNCDLDRHISYEKVITPYDWRDPSRFGAAHHLRIGQDLQ